MGITLVFPVLVLLVRFLLPADSLSSVVTPTTALRLASVPSMLVTPPQDYAVFTTDNTTRYLFVQGGTTDMVARLSNDDHCLLVWEASSVWQFDRLRILIPLSTSPPHGVFFLSICLLMLLFPFPSGCIGVSLRLSERAACNWENDDFFRSSF